jgi:hypothetical protein
MGRWILSVEDYKHLVEKYLYAFFKNQNGKRQQCNSLVYFEVNYTVFSLKFFPTLFILFNKTTLPYFTILIIFYTKLTLCGLVNQMERHGAICVTRKVLDDN